MSSGSGAVARVRRILELAERLLEELAGLPPGGELFERHLAFRWDASRGPGRIVPVEQPHEFELSDLIGVEAALSSLTANIEQFVAGHPSNHVLLFGARGTGKSSAVKGLLSRFGSKGLRIVEVHKSDLAQLPRVLTALRGSRQRFVLFCDDLSFDRGESEYRELKAALEGSLVAPPENVRIIATSNRRHLLPERASDNRAVRLDDDGELQIGEAIDEQLALSDRFGLVLGFYSFDQKTYLEIVDHYAKKARLRTAPEQIEQAALRWALRRSSRSGRTARQFVDDLAGREALGLPPRDR
ncbi:MAG TPA: ATP-binding protein [Myxococcota bacterium]|nr:ATP-binding protein [Myxococcota bacterium]